MIAERIGIVGLGLIGGSLALSLKGKPGAPEVWGCDRSGESVRKARRSGAIARACKETEIAACDIVVVCVPVIRSVGLIRRIGKRMRPGTVLTDVGSQRIGLQDYVELRAGPVTVKITNNSHYFSEDHVRVLHRTRVSKTLPYKLMYRSIAAQIADDQPGDSPASIRVSSDLVLELEAERMNIEQSGVLAPDSR